MSNSVVTLSSFNLLFLTQVLTVLTSTIKYNEYVTDKGENISIPCIADSDNIMWVKENGSSNNTIIQTGKYLVLTNVSASDRGMYVCFAAVTPHKRIADTTTTTITNSHSNNSIDSNEVVNGEYEQSRMKNVTEAQVTADTNTQMTKNKQSTIGLDEPLLDDYRKTQNSTTTTTTTTTNASTTSMLPMPRDAPTTNVASTSSSSSSSTASTSTDPASMSKANNFSSADTTNFRIKSNTTTTNTTSTTTTSSSNSSSNSNSRSTLNLNISNGSSNSSSSNTNSNILTLTSAPSPPPFFAPTATTLNAKSDDGVVDEEIQEFQAFQKINLTVRTPPGPVTQLYFKASTILGFLVWRFNKTSSGGYPVRSFTAEFRNVSYVVPPYNATYEHQWSRMDPINIAPNVRQMEVYRLEPNTTYEFRLWANNHLGSGEVVTTNVTTLPETKEEDLIRLIQPDLDNFDPRIWIVAVSIVLGTFVILAIGLCIVLSKECYQSSQAERENGWDNIELIPNIILNPGFCETDGPSPTIPTIPLPTFSRTIAFGDDDSDYSCESESDHEPRMEKFKRKLSVFFTDPTIKRI